MKHKFFFTFVAIATLFAAACGKDDENASSSTNNTLSQKMVGTWIIDAVSLNGSDLGLSNYSDITVTLRTDGSGIVVGTNKTFSWSVSDDSVFTVSPEGQTSSVTYHLAAITNRECTLTGTTSPFDLTQQGNYVIHLVKSQQQSSGQYAQWMPGTWRLDRITFNGVETAPENMLIYFYSDGTGLLNDNGVTENNGFGWSISGNILYLTLRHGESMFTINSMTPTEATFSGSEAPGYQEPGNAVLHFTKVS